MITNLTTMGKSEDENKIKIKNMLGKIDERVDACYQCGKCTSGCEAMKLLELEPHHIVAMTKMGFIDELINSDVIWTCVTCFKCKERCPQRVAPVELLFLLKNIAVARGKEIPANLSIMFQNILSQGMIQTVQEVATKDGKGVRREDLGLPKMILPPIEDFQPELMKLAMEEI